MRADKRGFWFLGEHKYGRYLLILTPAGSEELDGLQPWEGITGRVRQEINRLMAEIQRRNAAMNSRVGTNQDAIEGVERKLDGLQVTLERIRERIEKLLSALPAKSSE